MLQTDQLQIMKTSQRKGKASDKYQKEGRKTENDKLKPR